MDQYIKTSIDSRKEAFFNSFSVPEEFKKKIDELFKKIEELGKSCKDVGDFETKFAASPLNQQYLDLFTELATSVGAKPVEDEVKRKQNQGIAEAIAEGVMESSAQRVKQAVMPTRAAVNQKVMDSARSMPVVGEALHVKQYADLFGGFGRARKAKKEQEELKKQLEEDQK